MKGAPGRVHAQSQGAGGCIRTRRRQPEWRRSEPPYRVSTKGIRAVPARHRSEWPVTKHSTFRGRCGGARSRRQCCYLLIPLRTQAAPEVPAPALRKQKLPPVSKAGFPALSRCASTTVAIRGILRHFLPKIPGDFQTRIVLHPQEAVKRKMPHVHSLSALSTSSRIVPPE